MGFRPPFSSQRVSRSPTAGRLGRFSPGVQPDLLKVLTVERHVLTIRWRWRDMLSLLNWQLQK